MRGIPKSLWTILLPVLLLLFDALGGLVVFNGAISVLNDMSGYEAVGFLGVIGILGGGVVAITLRALDPRFQHWRMIALGVVWMLGMGLYPIHSPAPFEAFFITMLLLWNLRRVLAVGISLSIIMAAFILDALSQIDVYPSELGLGITETAYTTPSPLLGLGIGLFCGLLTMLILGFDNLLDPDAEERRQRERELYAPLAQPPRKLNSEGFAISDDGEIIELPDVAERKTAHE